MAWTYTDAYYKSYTRDTWDACAASYVPLQEQLVPYHRALLEVVRPRPGERVLDVCTGPGEPAMAIASLVRPDGRVVGVDLSASMTGIARTNAERRGLENVQFLTMDAERLELQAESFDVAVSCFGFQIVTDPEAAAREIHRVLEPGGRAGFTVWGPGHRAPAIDVVVGPMLEHATPDESGYLPTPYELGGEGELAALLEAVGFEGASETRVTERLGARSVERFLEMLLDGTPIGHSLREEEPSIQEIVIAKTRRNIARYLGPHGVSIPAECVIVTASKPERPGACGPPPTAGNPSPID